ncbi:MAG: amidohydrolase family protein [Actinomycetota bacterium]|nr:amidohydrolase family protein [Actinomycetota bacterium]
MLIDRGTITAVGSVRDVRAQAGGPPELAYPGCTIMPGFINAHVPLAFAPGPDRLGRLTDDRSPTQIVLAMAGHARQLLDTGVTTVRDLGAMPWPLAKSPDPGSWLPPHH